MKKINVYTHYDNTKTVIAHIIPFMVDGKMCITQQTYNRCFRKRIIGGDAGIYHHETEFIFIVDKHNNIINFF